MAPQVYDWTCAACSLDWVKVSVGLTPASDRENTVYEIGYPDDINPVYGLMDASGEALRGVLRDYDQPSAQGRLSFDEVYEIAQDAPGMLSGASWYHWVALRGVQGTNLWIANSAPGYKGVWDVLSREDYERLGPFNVVWLVD